MVQPTIGTNIRLSIISGIALVVWVLSSPIGTPQAPNVCVYTNSPSENFARASDGHGVALASAAPDRAFIDADRSDFIEDDEDESFKSFSHLASPILIASDWPAKIRSGPLPSNSPSMSVAVPLRC